MDLIFTLPGAPSFPEETKLLAVGVNSDALEVVPYQMCVPDARYMRSRLFMEPVEDERMGEDVAS